MTGTAVFEPHSSLGLRERNKRATRSALIGAARQLLSEQGSFTAEEIAHRAAVSRATYFNYFPGKDDLLSALYVEHMAALAAVVDGLLASDLNTRARIEGLFGDFAVASQLYPDYLRAVAAEFERTFADPQTSSRHTEMFIAQVIRILDGGLARGEVRTDYGVRFLAGMIGAIYINTIRYWREQPDVPAFLDAGRFAAESVGSSTPQRRSVRRSSSHA